MALKPNGTIVVLDYVDDAEEKFIDRLVKKVAIGKMRIPCG